MYNLAVFITIVLESILESTLKSVTDDFNEKSEFVEDSEKYFKIPYLFENEEGAADLAKFLSYFFNEAYVSEKYYKNISEEQLEDVSTEEVAETVLKEGFFNLAVVSIEQDLGEFAYALTINNCKTIVKDFDFYKTFLIERLEILLVNDFTIFQKNQDEFVKFEYPMALKENTLLVYDLILEYAENIFDEIDFPEINFEDYCEDHVDMNGDQYFSMCIPLELFSKLIYGAGFEREWHLALQEAAASIDSDTNDDSISPTEYTLH